MTSSVLSILKESGYRDTEPRRLVVEALERMKDPVSPYDIHAWLRARNHAVNTVTVYRVIAVLEKLGLVHRHPCDGTVSLCAKPHASGQHLFLHCHDCGSIEECVSRSLQRTIKLLASKEGFHPSSSIAEINGTCRLCS